MLAITATVAVTVKARGKKALQTKAAPNARSRSTFRTDAGFNFEMQRKGTGGRTHSGEMSIDRGLSIANANSYITKKVIHKRFYVAVRDEVIDKIDRWKFVALYDLASTSIPFAISAVLSENVDSVARNCWLDFERKIAGPRRGISARHYSAALNAAQR